MENKGKYNLPVYIQATMMFLQRNAKKFCHKTSRCSVFFALFLREKENLLLAFFSQKHEICFFP